MNTARPRPPVPSTIRTPRQRLIWETLAARLYPDQATLESRIGTAVGMVSDANLEALGWRLLSDGRWLRDLTEAPRDRASALGAAYLRELHERPELWDRVLTFDSKGARVLSSAPLLPGTLLARLYHGPALPPVALAELAGALLCALDMMRPPTPWGRLPPMRRHLEALAHVALPASDPPTLLTTGIPVAYLAAHGTAHE